MRDDALRFLLQLLETPSPSGFEADVQRLWLARVGTVADRCWNDAYGNCFAELAPGLAPGPAPGPAIGHAPAPGPGLNSPAAPLTVAICGHADEIGLMVNHIDEKGFVYCKAIGGIDPASIVGKRVFFRSSVPGVVEPVLGLIGSTAPHLMEKSGDAKVRKLHELFVDIGASDRASADSRLAVGDAGVFSDGPIRLGDDLLVARALDNRVGIWVAAEALRQIAEARSDLRVRVVAVSTVQEETGGIGAQMIAESIRPDVALVTDVGHATDSPGIAHAQHGLVKLGQGPRIALGGAMQRNVVQRLRDVAARLEIPLQRGAVPGRSGTDTDSIVARGGGIASGLVSLPIRYMHSTVETTSLRDLQRIADLFAAFCLSIAEGERFTLRLQP